MVDEEDAAQSALKSFCRQAKAGEFPELHKRENLLSLLATITRRKVEDHIKREQAKKRGGGRTVGGPLWQKHWTETLPQRKRCNLRIRSNISSDCCKAKLCYWSPACTWKGATGMKSLRGSTDVRPRSPVILLRFA